MELINQIPDVFINFLITLAFSLLIGIEQKKHFLDKTENMDTEVTPKFGTDRTFAFIGTLGYMLFIAEPKNLSAFILGGAVLAVLTGIFYYSKIIESKAYGVTSIIVAFITYALGPLVITQPKWLSIVVVVAVLILVERKDFLENISAQIQTYEFTTLGKFLVIAGVILPIAPKTYDIPYVNLSPYTLWVTVVVVSSISYTSYLLQKFVFKNSGVLISGILGGLYSSTATTLILAKRSRETGTGESNQYAASVVTATGMMYIRILILMFIFNQALGMLLLPYFGILIAVSIFTAGSIYFIHKPPVKENVLKPENGHENPLELKTAAIFAVLFVFFSMLTHYVLQSYGFGGLNVLSYAVGFTDIDPFLLNLFQGKYSIGIDLIAKASLQAVISNNILKAIYTYIFADKHTKKISIIGLAVITIVNIILAIII